MPAKKGNKSTEQEDLQKLLKCAAKWVDLIVRRLLPNGRLRNQFWISRDPQRPQDTSANLSVNVVDGTWTNFHDGKTGNCILTLVMYAAGITQIEAAEALRSILINKLKARPDAD